MEALTRYDLIGVLRGYAATGRPLIGICLGMQLMLSESHEFGHYRGLGIIEGDVIRFDQSVHDNGRLKIPQVGWNQLREVRAWKGTMLEGVPRDSFMYFVHSYYTRPAEADKVLSTTTYGGVEFCSSFQTGNVFGCQFHPERSGTIGLTVYETLGALLVPSLAKD